MQLPSEERFAPGEPMTVTVSENGVHEYTFADAAGNVTAVSVEVTDIDTAAPVLAFKLSENGAEYSSWAELAEQNDVAELDSVFFKSNEAGKYTFQQLEGSIAADAWTKLSINRDGVYPLSVWDTAGNMTFTGLSGILVPDNTPPVLWITPQRISVNQGISDAELEAAFKDGALVSDDISETDKITLIWDTSELNVNAAGEYTVIYTAA